MAKYEIILKGDFVEFLNHIDEIIMNRSLSVHFEDGNDVNIENTRVAIRVYERYSYFGGNRVSMNVTVVGNDSDILLTAITSGGSQAVFFKVNTIGEDAFLEDCVYAVEDYIEKKRR